MIRRVWAAANESSAASGRGGPRATPTACGPLQARRRSSVLVADIPPPTVGHTPEHEVEWDQRCSDGCDGANNVLRGEPGMAPATPAPAEPSLEPPAQY